MKGLLEKPAKVPCSAAEFLSHEPAGWLTPGAKIMLGPALATLFGGDTHNSELFIVIFAIVSLK
jgi:hypothetical protein